MSLILDMHDRGVLVCYLKAHFCYAHVGLLSSFLMGPSSCVDLGTDKTPLIHDQQCFAAYDTVSGLSAAIWLQ